MAINKNHEFEDLDGVKSAIVEKNVSSERVEFLKNLLQYNGYTVVAVKSPPPKVATAKPAPPVAEGVALVPQGGVVEVTPVPEPPATFTVGVTDVTFNATNAIMGRLLYAPNGSIVTQAYWFQKESVSNDEIPYYEKKF
jgi:hypothetical protein